MNLKRILLLVVLADALLSIGSFFIDTTGFAIRDPEFTGIAIDAPEAQNVIMFGLLVVGWIGILCFWNPARYFYLGAWAIALLNYATADSYKAPGWLYALYNLIGIIGGFLIALIFFSDLRHRFNRHETQLTQSSAETAQPRTTDY